MKKQRPGRRYRFAEGLEAEAERPGLGAEISEPVEDTRLLRFSPPLTEDWLERNGQVPLPPYIRRADSLSDAERYQTIFAKTIGSAASPTAGLHFTEALVNELRASGVQMAVVTLHVGLGTFLPVRTEEIEDHSMHEESWIISAETAGAVNRAKAERRPVLAVGTTSLRTLESAYFRGDEFGKPGVLAGEGKTKIFIRPGYEWKVVDGLFTNFHTPRSTLLMLVSAFAGREHILRAYEEAIRLGYRFFSYGDAMLVQ
jgi:S-adenosylmethionine:tRNA ribosyltransferase-isomerase